MNQQELKQMRKEYNKLILHALEKYLSEHEDIRFFQALYNMNIIRSHKEDMYYEEPNDTFRRIITKSI